MNTKLFHLSFFFFLSLFATQAQSRDTLNLEGNWRFQKDENDHGIPQQWFSKKLTETIKLPGSMRVRGKGDPVTLQTKWTGSIYDSSFYFNPRLKKYRQPKPMFPFWLTPKKQYVGAAWYQKEVLIPKSWKKKHMYLFLERAHTETILWVDSTKVGMQNSMVAPHVYELSSLLPPGKHTLTLRVDNRIKDINVGPDSHSLTDHTQGNWNGIIGKMKLIATAPVYIQNAQAYPNLSKKEVVLKIALSAINAGKHSGKIKLSGHSFNTKENDEIAPKKVDYNFSGKTDSIEVTVPMGENFLTWDEFHPALYRLTLNLAGNNTGKDQVKVEFGMREFKAEGRKFTINNRPVFLRGTVDNAVFPLTGYPDMDLKSWLRIFKIIKNHGLNHVRYHSWCPPEAAFKAADRMGFYLQPEGPSWANHGTGLGLGRPIDQFIYDETNRMETYYGNHASYCMMAYGNEPAGKQVEYLTKFNNYWKAKDSRRLYTGASVGGSWPVILNNEYMVRGGARDLHWKNLAPQTEADFSKQIAKFKVPFVSHEMGQYCVFPNFKETKKYTGAYEARNFQLFQEDLKDHHMEDQAQDFLMASGKLQALCYKYTIEKALRTPGYSGFQLLSLNDYPGQGTALVGVLDAFWDPKPYIDAKEFKEFCASVVPLAKIPKFVFTTDEKFSANIEISNYSSEKLKNSIYWNIKDKNGQFIKEGSFTKKTIDFGLTSLGNIQTDLNQFKKPQKLTLTVSVEGTSFQNHWNFWVFPSELPKVNSAVYYTDTLDAKTKNVLKNGGKVFLNLAGKVVKGKEVVQTFLPVFWNTSWFQMRPPHTLGILVNPENPILHFFPTAYHSDLQWWSILNKTQVMNLEDFPPNFKPLIQPIDTWFMNRRLASAFEVKVGKGKLLVCSVNLNSSQKDAAAHQLYYSIQKYMASKDFNPKTEVNLQTIKNIMEKPSRQQFDNYSKDAPDELKPKKTEK